jgi:alpha-galactosidase
MFSKNNNSEKEKRSYPILWDQIGISPSIQLKFGIKRRLFSFENRQSDKRGEFHYFNDYAELTGKWDNSPVFGSLLNLKIKNISKKSIRIARIVFPTENGLDAFLDNFKTYDISFLRNGYQSWSTSRSYKVMDKPLRPWLQIVSLTSSNMANLPSNTAGNLSSEMYSVITDLKKNESFLVGQTSPFNQFFYIRLIIHKTDSKPSHFELVYDFGNKMILPQETINLDGILMAKGDMADLQKKYFSFIKKQMNIKVPKDNIKGWSSWYYYYNKITPEVIYQNISVIKQKKMSFDFIQLDDGYQKYVGDWLDLTPAFSDRMKEIADTIRDAGFRPGIWIAPFIAEKKSELVNTYPDYVLRTEFGKPIIAGYNPSWESKFYYGLDITNPRFEEYIRNVIRTIVWDWGYKYLKLDFMFGGCIRGGNHNNYRMSRAEILKYGIKIIHEEAGKDVILAGCGMPITTGIGTVNIMRVGPDTADYWKTIFTASLLRTGAMLGLRNSIRNFSVRSFMNKNLWINDPDCLILRNTKTHYTKHERMTGINAIILSGGLLTLSDNLAELTYLNFAELKKIETVSLECYRGETVPVDLMEKEMPEIYYNSSGYIGIFNFGNMMLTKTIDMNNLMGNKRIDVLMDVWSDEIHHIASDGIFLLKNMPPHSSRLFKF